MPFSFLFGKLKPPVYAVIDAGSHAIKIVVFEIPSDGRIPHVLKKRTLRVSSVHNPVRGVSKLRELLFDTVKHLGRIPSKILISFGPRFVRTRIDTWLAYCGPKERLLNRKALANCFQRLFLEHYPFGKAFFAYPLDLFVNGYLTSPDLLSGVRPEDVETISFRALFAEFHEDVGEGVAEIKRSLGGMPVEFIPLAAALGGVFVKKLNTRDAFLVDVGEGHTVLTLLKDGRIVATASFAKGTHDFLRSLGRLFSVSADESADMKRRYEQGTVKGHLEQKIHSAFEGEAESWKQGLVQTLDIFYPVAPIPPRVFIFGGGAHIPEILKALAAPDWLSNYSYISRPEVRVFEGKSVFGGDTLGGTLGGPEDTGLASLMAFTMDQETLF